jgi:hypothetical protein
MRPDFCGQRRMLDALRRQWRHFKKSRPGRRFQDSYDRKRESRGGMLWRCALMVFGAALCLIGLFFMAVPGPGIPILAVGAVLLAQQSQAAARLLDRAEIRVRKMLRR